MATVSLAESAAPRDFQISVSSGSARYTRCLLCAAGRRAFYCAECIASGNFVHSSVPYSERFADKKLKLYRLKTNRNHVKERCKLLLVDKNKHERLQIDTNQCKEQIGLLKLAIEQTRSNVAEKQQQLDALTRYNGELQVKLPRYQKRVAALEKHALGQEAELRRRAATCGARADELAALRRARLRQLMNYIFPVHLSYDDRRSLAEEEEFLREVGAAEAAERTCSARLHIAAAWLPANGDYSSYTQWVSAHKDEASGSGTPGPEVVEHPVYRISAGLSLAAQLTTLAASYLAVRLPYKLHFSSSLHLHSSNISFKVDVVRSWIEQLVQTEKFDYCSESMSEATLEARARRLLACVVWVCLHARRPPPPAPRHALTLLHALHTAAADDDPHLGRVESSLSGEMVAAAEAWACAGSAEAELSDGEEPEPPEHLHWDHSEELGAVSASPPGAPAASLVTSAAASLASIWRGWTK